MRPLLGEQQEAQQVDDDNEDSLVNGQLTVVNYALHQNPEGNRNRHELVQHVPVSR